MLGISKCSKTIVKPSILGFTKGSSGELSSYDPLCEGPRSEESLLHNSIWYNTFFLQLYRFNFLE